MQQLLLFSDPEVDVYIRKMEKLIEKYDTLRKSQFAKISFLEKQLREYKERLNLLEAYICKGGYVR